MGCRQFGVSCGKRQGRVFASPAILSKAIRQFLEIPHVPPFFKGGKRDGGAHGVEILPECLAPLGIIAFCFFAESGFEQTIAN